MEDNFPKSHQENTPTDDDTSREARTARRQARFLHRNPSHELFQRVLEAKTDEEDEEEEDDDNGREKKTSKTSRFRRPFRKLFRRGIVRPPEHIVDDQPEGLVGDRPERRSVVPFNNFGEWLRKMSTSLDGEEAPAAESPETVGNDRTTVEAILASVSGAEQPAADRVQEDFVSETLSSVETPENSLEERSEPDLPNDTSEQSLPLQEPESLQQILARQSQNTEYGSVGSSLAGEQTPPATTNITNETYVNNASWGPALIVDQLSRHRDRKIKRTDRQQDRKIEAVQTHQQEQSSRYQGIENNYDRLKQQVRELETKSAPERNTQQVTPVVERLTSPSTLPEKFVAPAPEKVRPLPDIRIDQADAIVNISPETILKTVEKAAETSVPIESLYERRHEVKGSEDFAASADAAIKSHDGTSVPQATSEAGVTPTVPQTPSSTTKHGNQEAKISNSLYKQAAKGGVAVAIAVLVAFLVLYIIS